MAPNHQPDDDDTHEQPVARYPDAAPAAGEPADAPAAGEPGPYGGPPAGSSQPDVTPPAAQPWSAPTAQWPQPNQQLQQQPPTAAPQWQQPPAPQPPAQQWQGQPAQPWQQPPAQQWQGQSGWAPQQEYRGGDYPTSPLVTIAAIVLIVFGLLATLIGGLGVAVGGFVEQAIREARDQGVSGLEGIDLSGIGEIFVVIFAVVLILGILHIVSAIGIFLHKQWARIIGIALAVLGTLFGVLGMVGASGVAGSLDGSEWFFPVALAIGYGFTLFALIAGGSHFRRRYIG